MIRVREATREDAAAMSDVLIASITALCVADHQNRAEAVSRWLANKTPEGVLSWFDTPGNRIFVAEHDGATAAAGACNGKREIILNYVSPEHRFAGVSTALLAAMGTGAGPRRGNADQHRDGAPLLPREGLDRDRRNRPLGRHGRLSDAKDALERP